MAKKAKKSQKALKGVIADSKLEIKVEKKKKDSSRAAKVITPIIVLLVLIGLFYIFTSTQELDSVSRTNYTINESYVEQVPYTITEEYEEKVPYGLPYCGRTSMNFTASKSWTDVVANNTVACKFNLTNLELKEGTWEYRAYLQTNKGATGNRYDRKAVAPNSTETFEFIFKLNSKTTTFGCQISAQSLPSIERCYFPEETFYKTVTKTREVTRYKNVTKQKEVTLVNETTISYSVNRFFGYQMNSWGW